MLGDRKWLDLALTGRSSERHAGFGIADQALRASMRDIQLDLNAVHDAARKAAERREKAELATIELNERTKEQNRILEEQNRQLKETNQQLLLRLGGPVMSDREKLLHLIDEAEELAKKRVDASNPQFCAWRTNVERLLIKTFGEQSYEFKEFKRLDFSLCCFSTGTPKHAWNDACVHDLERAQAILKTYVDDMSDNPSVPARPAFTYDFDVFLSHACKDKGTLVDALQKSLCKLGVTVWYDSAELEWGDDWKSKIMDGLGKCHFAIVVLSPEFLNREWTEKELYELLSRQNERHDKLVLPLLYNLTVEEMKKQYPSLGAIQAYVLGKDEDVKDITIKFARIFIKDLKGTRVETGVVG